MTTDAMIGFSITLGTYLAFKGHHLLAALLFGGAALLLSQLIRSLGGE